MDVALRCGIPDLQQALLTLLQQRGWRHNPDAPLLAMLDAPFGYALRTLPAAALAHRQVVVVTHNPCPEYWDDLWEFRPAILRASQCRLPALERALIDAAAGRRARLTPPHASPLTPAERAVLRAIAHGRTNQQIAQDLRLSARRIANLGRRCTANCGCRDAVPPSCTPGDGGNCWLRRTGHPSDRLWRNMSQTCPFRCCVAPRAQRAISSSPGRDRRRSTLPSRKRTFRSPQGYYIQSALLHLPCRKDGYG
ncbi:LuxR C-terminal-related transcriptional regulator [Roseiflexus castenholzii]|nr:LuxR C-terminal-related transcriptional regulator [Roseiflexus castenholzii]